ADREARLRAAGYRVLRVENAAVLDRLPAVLRQIHAAALEQPVVPAPERRRAAW
ncbi:MAG: hypothetical protein IT338_14340, partial [Thermomicrobiales bacterium]|nr:hypothetical protein [Thermomicrobiales bacterium]